MTTELRMVSLVGLTGLLFAIAWNIAVYGESDREKQEAEKNNAEWNQRNPRPYDGNWILDNQHDT